MLLSVRTYKKRKSDSQPEYKTYRYPCFDTDSEMEGKSFPEKFNHALDVLKEEINQDREHNDMNLYEPIVIADLWLS